MRRETRSNYRMVGMVVGAVVAFLQSAASLAQGTPVWKDNGGTLVTDPSCAFYGAGVVCAAVGARGTLIVNRLEGSTWTGFQDLGGVVTRKPSCARMGIIGAVCAVIDFNSEVQVNIFNGATWSGFQYLGGKSVSDPACVGTAFLGSSATHCAVIGTDGALHVNTFNGTAWQGFQKLGGNYVYNPTCTEDWTFQNVFCAAVTIGAQLEGWKFQSSTWNKMPQAVGTAITADPDCTGIGREQILCAMRSGTRLKVNRADNASTWPMLTDLGGTFADAPSCMPTMNPHLGTQNATCSVRALNSVVHAISFDGSTWNGFRPIPGVRMVGQPNCIFFSQAQTLCAVRGTDNRLYTLLGPQGDGPVIAH